MAGPDHTAPQRTSNRRGWPKVLAVLGLVMAAGLGWWWQQRTSAAQVAPVGVTGTAVAGGQQAGAGGSTPAGAGASGSGRQGGASGGGQGGGQGGGPVAVEVAKATSMKIEDDAQAVGTMQAKQSVMLRPEVSGRVLRMGFKDGQSVKRGQVLIQFDDTLQQAQWRQAEAQAAIARTNLQRQRDLVAQNFVSQSAVDQSAAALEVAQAQVALAKAQLMRMRITAPFDGVVGITNIDPGDYLREGADVVSIDDIATMVVDFRLPERYAARVQPGQSVSLTLDALPGEVLSGKVQALDSQLDTNGRSLLVRASVDNAKRTLKTGMFARTRIVFATKAGAVVVPEEAIVPQGGKQYVVKVVDAPALKPQDDSVSRPQGPSKVSQRLEAKLGVRTEGKVEVLEGVAPGDVVVTAGHARLLGRDGLPLRVVDLERPALERPAGAASGAGGPRGQGGQASGQAPASSPPATKGDARDKGDKP